MLKGAFIGRDKDFSSTIIHFPVQCSRSVDSLPLKYPRKEFVVYHFRIVDEIPQAEEVVTRLLPKTAFVGEEQI